MTVRRALVLLSGGMDSIAVCRYLLARPEHWALTRCLTVDYGQPAAQEEVIASAKWCRENGIDHEIRTVELDAGELARGDSEAPRVVPGRNAVLLSLGVHVAAAHGSQRVVLGATGSDWGAYPDCRREFLEALSKTFVQAYGVGIAAPLHATKKAEVAKLLTAEDLEVAFSCYTPAGRGRHCGRCRSCIERMAALSAASPDTACRPGSDECRNGSGLSADSYADLYRTMQGFRCARCGGDGS